MNRNAMKNKDLKVAVSVVVPSLIVPGHIQVLQHDQHLVSMGGGSQAGGDPTSLVGGIVLVPVGLHLVGPHLACVGSVSVPAARVLGLLRKLDVFGDHGWPVTALQVQPDNLAVAAPQSLDLCTDTKGRSPARLQDQILILLFHFWSVLKRKRGN